MKLAFIGLGTMGGAMAANLQKAGHEVRANDLRKVEGFKHWCATAAEAAESCDLIFTSLPGPDDVDKVGAALKPVLHPGAVWFDLSTNSPQRVRRLHAELAKQGVHFLDAPVSGGASGAKSGRLMSSLCFENETVRGMSSCSASGVCGQSTMLVIMVGPSSSFTTAMA